jgi:hypothetical protein
MSSDAAASEPATKKIRSIPTDLQILVGSSENGKQEVFFHHSAILATHSDYVDAMLATPMVESETREISFSDIEPDVWMKMLAFLEDPLVVRGMKFEDAMLVLPYYDKYQFRKGKELCDALLAQGFESKCDTNSLAGLDTLVDTLLLAGQMNLINLKRKCIELLRHQFAEINEKLGNICDDNTPDETKIIFHADHIKKLMPFIAEDEQLLLAVKSTRDRPSLHYFRSIF